MEQTHDIVDAEDGTPEGLLYCLAIGWKIDASRRIMVDAYAPFADKPGVFERPSGKLETALAEAFAYGGPCLIDIHLGSIAERVPPVYRGRDPLTFQPEDVSRV